jgi:hypothetical protein
MRSIKEAKAVEPTKKKKKNQIKDNELGRETTHVGK